MQDKIKKQVGFFWATAIGGVFFLLPLAVVAFMLAQIYSIVQAIAKPLHDWVPVNSPGGVALLFSLAVAILVLLCFVGGIIATRALGRQFSTTLEKQVMTVFPKYAIYRDLLASNLQQCQEVPSLKSILVSTSEGSRLAFESDRLANGMVVVYFPGAPDTWIGSVALVPAERVHATELSFKDAVGLFERMGRNSKQLFDK